LMEKNLRLSFRRGDVLAVAVVLLLAVCTLLAYLPKTQATEQGVVQVYRDSVLVEEMPLEEDRVFYVDGDYRNEVTVQSGTVRVSHSNCPGTDCVYMQPISAPGRTLVCLPNRVEIRVVNADGTAQSDDDVDFVVR